MKLILKKNGNLFLWVVLPLLFLISAVAGVSLVSKDVESSIGRSCYQSPELLTCLPAETPTQCIERVGTITCEGSRTSNCQRERCRVSGTNAVCVSDGADTTSPGCVYIPGCPNGILDAGEQCDSTDDIGQCASIGPGLHCRACRCVSQCGDGVRANSEQCDPNPGGRRILGPDCGPRDTCSRNCKCLPPVPKCGDDVAEGTEQCDGSDTHLCPVPGSTCNSSCACVAPPRCGDGAINGSDQCDVGAGRDSASMEAGNAQCVARSIAVGDHRTICDLATCTCNEPPPICGDGRVNGTDQCEVDGDCAARGGGLHCVGCRCVSQCGDGAYSSDEQCDVVSGRPVFDPGRCAGGLTVCTSDCRCVAPPPRCGDGAVNGTDQCDGGPPSSPMAANTQCEALPVAGGGVLGAGATCNLGTCQCNPPPRCGDGAINGTDQCDGGAARDAITANAQCASRPAGTGGGVGATCNLDTCQCNPPPRCGDGAINGTDQCDGGSSGDATTANAQCASRPVASGGGAGATCNLGTCQCNPPPFCGDRTVNAGEQCEVDADCASRGVGLHCAGCVCVPRCGDGVRAASEACEGTDATTCSVAGSRCEGCTCVAPRCGNSMVEGPAEQCDGDPGVCPVAGSRCEGCQCIAPVCGNGIREGSEACDGPDRGRCTAAGSRCEGCQCITPFCGDGITNAGEECDRNDATCNSNAFCVMRYTNPRATFDPNLCKCVVPAPVCGNGGLPEAGEECDGSADICPTSGSTCRDCRCIPPVKQPQAICGDGRVNQDAETCDSLAGTTDVRLHPENPMGYNLLGPCRADCTYCGDGIKNGSEDCDPRASSLTIPAGQYCDNNCKLQPISVTPATSPSCGDGSVNSGEACDVVAGSPLGCLINPENHRPEADCVNCTCVPWIIEGGGGPGGTFKCSFDPSASFNISSFLIQLALISFLPLGAMWRLRRKK